MSGEFVLNAELRQDTGKGSSRRLRRLANQLPAIVYGGGQEPQGITLTLREITKALENERFYSHVITLNIAGKEQDVILKDLQRHPARETVMHADFLRVVKGQKVTVHVQLHFINEDKSPAVKLQGGLITHQATEIEVRCLPTSIPDFIEVDMSGVNIGDSLHISDLKLPEGVESVALAHDHDLSLAVIVAPRADKEEAPAAAPAAAAKPEEKGKS